MTFVILTTLIKFVFATTVWFSDAIAINEKLPKSIINNIIIHESKGYWFAKSSTGCVGLMQIDPRYSSVPEILLYVGPINRLEGGKHLKYWLKRSRGNWTLALAGYGCGNAGLRGECSLKFAKEILDKSK